MKMLKTKSHFFWEGGGGVVMVKVEPDFVPPILM